MGLSLRFKNVCKGYFGKMLSKAEDPEVMLEQLITDSKAKFEKVQIETAKAISARTMVKKEYEAQVKKCDEFLVKAKTALKAGKEGIATEFLEQKKDEEEIMSEIKVNLDMAMKQEEALRDELVRLTKVMRKAEARKQLVVARNNRVKAQEAIQEVRHDLDTGSTLSEIGKIEKKIDEKEAFISGKEEVHSLITKSDVERELEQIQANEVNEEVQADLAKLKAEIEAEQKEVPLTKEA
ncbi:PspA/IM30 family protein [Bacillus sp. NPDC094106]|uniref:PspA/IM30 family protein n=1 Tax=Bacillus sp. NPDC094106 TaxID=3363949 RepID=UPI00382FC33F